MQLDRVSIGLPGSTDHAVIRAIAPRIEALGYRALWLNDTAQGDSLAGLRVAATVTSTLWLGTGVIPLDRRPAAVIAVDLGALPADRLVLGIGSGGPADALRRVREGVELLRQSTPATILVGALGPRMRALAAEFADGVLLNWLTPAAAAGAAAELQAENPRGRAVLYARTIVGADARPALEAEAAAYASYPSYAANFERINARAIDTTIDGTVPGALEQRVNQYLEHLDELVLRAVVAPGAGLIDFVERAAA